jgi:hypothetical protein
MNGPALKPRSPDISPTLDSRSLMARQRAKRTLALGRAVNEASRQLNRKIDQMLIQLEFRLFVSRADEALKQKGLELIANSLQKRREPSADAMRAFLSEAKKTASVSL